MVQRTLGIVLCAAYMAWASLAMAVIVSVSLFRESAGFPLKYSLPVFLALHPAVPLGSIPAIFPLTRDYSTAAFAVFAMLTAAAAVMLFQLHEGGRKMARWMAAVGVLAAIAISVVQTISDVVVVAAIVAPYCALFIYLGRDHVQLRFQMARKGGPPARRMFRPSS